MASADGNGREKIESDSMTAPAERVAARLYDLKWHQTTASPGEPEQWLKEFVEQAELCSRETVLATAQKEPGGSAALLRFMKRDDPETVDLAARGLALLAGQGTHTCPVHIGEHQLRLVQRAFAGAGDTLGHRLWPSANRLCDICLHAESLISGSRVLELGCGPGLPGLLCAQLGAASVMLTDCVPGVLELARQNVSINFSDEGAGTMPQVASLDWQDGIEGFNSFAKLHGKFDVILIADCVYDAWHAPAVISAATTLLDDAPGACVLAVLGDRAGRSGVELFEPAAIQNHFRIDWTIESAMQSEWILRRMSDNSAPAHNWASLTRPTLGH